jgi:hypothetical protein
MAPIAQRSMRAWLNTGAIQTTSYPETRFAQKLGELDRALTRLTPQCRAGSHDRCLDRHPGPSSHAAENRFRLRMGEPSGRCPAISWVAPGGSGLPASTASPLTTIPRSYFCFAASICTALNAGRREATLRDLPVLGGTTLLSGSLLLDIPVAAVVAVFLAMLNLVSVRTDDTSLSVDSPPAAESRAGGSCSARIEISRRRFLAPRPRQAKLSSTMLIVARHLAAAVE